MSASLSLWAFIGAAVFVLLLGPVFIPILTRLKFGQSIRTDGPQTHLRKAGTPTMGGIMFLVALTAATLYLARKNLTVYTVLLVTLGFGTIGFIDDFLKVVLRRPLGLKARHKLLGQFVLATLLVVVATGFLGRDTSVIIPFTRYQFDMGAAYYPFAVLVVVFMTNAVNLTDGLDGLAAGITVFAGLAYTVVAVIAGQSDLAIFSAALAGGCLGFLRHNAHPARVFMGDTGSLAIGAAVASLSILTRTELLLPLIGGLYVVEALSVVIQVISFQFTGKRIFRMSPLHHHFELSGWPEVRVVVVFWVVALALSVLGIYSAWSLG
ncbi:MAG: phospho-N-acetylmuramoyl-pentapeptide-transferase [Bacillota bacterium]